MKAEIEITREMDDCPDISHLGEFCDWQEGAIKRNPSYLERHSYEWILPAISRDKYFQDLHKIGYSKGVAAELAQSYVNQDIKRLESLERGDWYFIGIYATARKEVNGTIQTFRSGGLWGIESDSDESYLKEVEQEETEQLKSILAKLKI